MKKNLDFEGRLQNDENFDVNDENFDANDENFDANVKNDAKSESEDNAKVVNVVIIEGPSSDEKASPERHVDELQGIDSLGITFPPNQPIFTLIKFVLPFFRNRTIDQSILVTITIPFQPIFATRLFLSPFLLKIVNILFNFYFTLLPPIKAESLNFALFV